MRYPTTRLNPQHYTTFILPFVSTALLILAGALYFYRTHRLTDGLFRYVLDATLEVFHALEGELVRLMGGNKRQAVRVRRDS